jgi:leukotriene A-4 hydrolase/aminopeptidase
MTRNILSILTFCSSFFLISSCTEPPPSTQEESTIGYDSTDYHTFSDKHSAMVTHLHWDAKVNFDQKIISATASWDIENRNDTDTIVFDTYDMKIVQVTLNDGDETGFKVGESKPYMGSPLYVAITPGTKKVHITYSTSPNAPAVQWLNPSQTFGKEFPFLFTQSEAILARSWVPCQDSPGVKFTYSARVEVPNNLLALMSATNPQTKNDSGIYHFVMDQPIPSYLLALAVGNLEFGSVGTRTGVYAEPGQLQAAMAEFSETEKMLEIAEELFGKYQWERYDMLVLPPSFPFGGMENPRLTFVTPTIIAGDKSLTALIAHELAHSWSGNLVTNANWNDFWLNEGFTVFLERRIMDSLYGTDYADMLTILGRQDLDKEISELPDEDTRLKLDLKGRNPDDGMSDIAYEKGFFFLTLLQKHFGESEMDNFLKNYFEAHSFQNITTENFITYMDENLIVLDSFARPALRIEEWIYQSGLPVNCPTVSSTRFQNVSSTQKAWSDGAFTAEEIETTNWSTFEWLQFLRTLPDSLSQERFTELDQTFGFTQSKNSEIQAIWFEKSILGNYHAVDSALERFLQSVGRRKFLIPLYKAMLQADPSGNWAREVYQKSRPNYHSVSTETLDKLLRFESSN